MVDDGKTQEPTESEADSVLEEQKRSRAEVKAQAKAAASRVFQRLNREGRWKGQAEQARMDMIREGREGGMTAAEAKLWAYTELDRMYPPFVVEEEDEKDDDEGESGDTKSENETTAESDVTPPVPRTREDGVKGLSDIPDDWPEPPDNVSLAVEIAWVQANRLRIVDESSNSNAVTVHLDQARTPAPSWAALGWLETSFRNHAKYLDIVAKVASTAQDETDDVRQERLQIQEIRDILTEMKESLSSCT